MSNENIIEFNGKEVKYESITNEELIKLYRNIREKQVILYNKILLYKDELGIEDNEVENMLVEFEKSLL